MSFFMHEILNQDTRLLIKQAGSQKMHENIHPVVLHIFVTTLYISE